MMAIFTQHLIFLLIKLKSFVILFFDNNQCISRNVISVMNKLLIRLSINNVNLN